MKHKAEMLMRLLLNGAIIDHEGHLYTMAEDGSLGILFDRNDDVCHKVDCDLGAFVRMADKMDLDTLFLAGASLALQDAKQKRETR